MKKKLLFLGCNYGQVQYLKLIDKNIRKISNIIENLIRRYVKIRV